MHPVIEAAGRHGELPNWAQLGEDRRAHVERVAGLLSEWAAELGLSEDEAVRWRAAGRLHDALKDAPLSELRDLVPPNGWPDPLLHGPAVAGRLARDRVADEGFLLAVAYHSVGHASFDDLGVHLYLADYLEPGRPDERHRDELRARMPGGRAGVLPDVIRRRIGRQLTDEQAILPASVGFWNRAVGG